MKKLALIQLIKSSIRLQPWRNPCIVGHNL